MWYVLKAIGLSLSIREDLDKAQIKYYLPTHTQMRSVGGVQKRVETPLVCNFIFVQCELELIKKFCRDNSRLRLHLAFHRRNPYSKGMAKPLVINDNEMKMFQKAISFYDGQEIPFVKMDEIELEKGDVVRVIGGRFSGLEGTLISRKGKEGGRVVVNLSNVVAVRTLEIEPEYLQILRYGKGNKHLYKHIDSFIPRLEKAINMGGGLSVIDRTPVEMFVKRFCKLQTETLNAQVKVMTLLYASYIVLQLNEDAEVILENLKHFLPKVKSQTTIDFVNKYIQL